MAQDLLEDVRKVVAECIDQRTILNLSATAKDLARIHSCASTVGVERVLAELAARALVPMKLGRSDVPPIETLVPRDEGRSVHVQL